MKNKLLVSLFASAIAVFAFTSCETKSNVTDVCSDMIKESMHSAPRSLVKLDKHVLSIVEYEFAGGVNDNRLLYRSLVFGDGSFSPKKVDTLLYTYGEWQEHNTQFTLNVTPKEGEPYTGGESPPEKAGRLHRSAERFSCGNKERGGRRLSQHPDPDA